MQTTKLFILLLCCLGTLTFTQAKITSEQLENYRQSISTKLTSGSLHDLPDIYYKLLNLIHSGDKAEHKSTPKEAACNFLKKVGFEKAVDAGLGSEFISVFTTFGCSKDELKSEFNTLLKSAEKGDKLSDIHHALHLVQAHKTYNGTEVVEACNKVIDLIRDDGMARSNKRSGEYSFANTAKVFDILQICKSLDVLDSRALKRLDPIIKNVLQNARAGSKGGLLFPEGDFFLTTSNLISGILGVNPESIANEELSRLVTFFRSHEEHIDTPQRTHSFHKLGSNLKSVPTVRLVSPQIVRGKDTTLQLKVTNILGEEIAKPKNWKVKASIVPFGDSTAVVRDINFEKKQDENLYEAKIAANSVKKADVYQLKVSVSTGTSTYDYVDEVIVQDAVSIKSVSFDVTKSPDRPLNRFQHEVAPKETLKNRLTANQDNYIHIAIKADSALPAGLVGARLSGGKNRFSTGLVAATRDNESNLYRVVIDLGDPDHILPYNGQYDLEVIVSGGSIAESIRWTLANFDITFGKPADKAPVTDADVQLLPEIRHQFPAERRKPSVLLTGIFIGGIIVCVLGFLAVLSKLGVNLNNLPQSFTGKILTLVFLGLVVAVFGTLAMFWLKINIFETLLVLAVLAGPTVFIGDLALRSIGNNKKTN